jgi:phosphoserine phosphatase
MNATVTSSQPVSDPLSQWTDGPAKRAVLEAIASMTDESSESFIELRRRIATFDNDGTLWCEKPIPVQALFLLNRWRTMAQEDPSRREVQPYKAAAEGDVAWFSDLYAHVGELLKGAGEAYEGITPDDFEDAVRAFFDSARHPRFDVPLHHLTYLPMVQLMELLRGNGFKVLITTGGGRDFVRAVSEEIYDLPRDAVIGSSPAIDYQDGKLVRRAALGSPIDDGPGKPVHIFEHTGFAPAFAVGNSDGDIQMLQSARFALLLHHDDDEREYAYDTSAEKALAAAGQHNWVVVSMSSDFAHVFAGDRDRPAG